MKLRGTKLLEILEMIISERLSLRQMAERTGVSHMAVWRALNSEEFAGLLKEAACTRRETWADARKGEFDD